MRQGIDVIQIYIMFHFEREFSRLAHNKVDLCIPLVTQHFHQAPPIYGSCCACDANNNPLHLGYLLLTIRWLHEKLVKLELLLIIEKHEVVTSQILTETVLPLRCSMVQHSELIDRSCPQCTNTNGSNVFFYWFFNR